jgi:hypothetical protein
MQIEDPNVLQVERKFFSALTEGDSTELDHLLSDDFLLVDVLTGSEITREMLLAALSSGQLKFENIDQIESRIRFYHCAAVATGTTRMSGQFADAPFVLLSRYTHVYSQQQDEWHLVSAQGTQIANAE